MQGVGLTYPTRQTPLSGALASVLTPAVCVSGCRVRVQGQGAGSGSLFRSLSRSLFLSPSLSLSLVIMPGVTPLTPNTVELIPTVVTLLHRGGPVQDPVLTLPLSLSPSLSSGPPIQPDR